MDSASHAAPGRDDVPLLRRKPTREDVRACYHFILGRLPEDDAVLDRHLVQVATVEALRRRFFLSDEFRAGDPLRSAAPAALSASDAAIESVGSPEVLARMLERTGRYWTRIGGTEPWWSVLMQERFRAARIAESRAAFYQSGAGDAALLGSILERAGIPPAALPLSLEFGCGAGRVTIHLARLFAEVVGCDMSGPHLALAHRAAERRGIGNIRWHQSTAEAPMPAGAGCTALWPPGGPCVIACRCSSRCWSSARSRPANESSSPGRRASRPTRRRWISPRSPLASRARGRISPRRRSTRSTRPTAPLARPSCSSTVGSLT